MSEGTYSPSNRDKVREPRSKVYWCFGCDRYLVSRGNKCPGCGTLADLRTNKKPGPGEAESNEA